VEDPERDHVEGGGAALEFLPVDASHEVRGVPKGAATKGGEDGMADTYNDGRARKGEEARER
jgi:hypothetical protein